MQCKKTNKVFRGISECIRKKHLLKVTTPLGNSPVNYTPSRAFFPCLHSSCIKITLHFMCHISDQKGLDCPVSPFIQGFSFQFLFNVRLMVCMDLGLYTADFVQSDWIWLFEMNMWGFFFIYSVLQMEKPILTNFMLRGGLKCKNENLLKRISTNISPASKDFCHIDVSATHKFLFFFILV